MRLVSTFEKTRTGFAGVAAVIELPDGSEVGLLAPTQAQLVDLCKDKFDFVLDVTGIQRVVIHKDRKYEQ